MIVFTFEDPETSAYIKEHLDSFDKAVQIVTPSVNMEIALNSTKNNVFLKCLLYVTIVDAKSVGAAS